MFSQVSVILLGGARYITCIMDKWGTHPLLVTTGGDNPPPSRSNIYWWQIKLKHVQFPSGGLHPTGILSCLFSD